MNRLIVWLVNRYLDDALEEAYLKGWSRGYKEGLADNGTAWVDLEEFKVGGTDCD